MSGQTRFKGQFIKKKCLDKKLKIIAARNRSRKSSTPTNNDEYVDPNLCDGRRVVELKVLGKNLKCCKCKQVLSLENVVKEVHLGLNTILTVKCVQCSISTEVTTGKIHVTKNDSRYSDVNTRAVLGTLHAGIGYTGLNKILACLNVPTVSKSVYKRYEREVGPAIEEAAQDSCKRAAQEERRLVLENV